MVREDLRLSPTVEPPNKGQWTSFLFIVQRFEIQKIYRPFVHCREVVHSSECLYIIRGSTVVLVVSSSASYMYTFMKKCSPSLTRGSSG